MDPIALSVFSSRMAAVCEEMGAVLRRTAFSPNIRDRLDFSCAVFDADGGLAAQAAHIPVHLGSMAYAMAGVIRRFDWQPGDMVVFNDPFLGGTHLPDVTLVSPLFVDGERVAFLANRAHHADIGAVTPGSMPLSTTLEEEGVLISPVRLYRAGRRDEAVLQRIVSRTRNPRQAGGDFAAQASSVSSGVHRLQELVGRMGMSEFRAALAALNDYAERLVRAALVDLPDGRWTFTDYLDDDGQGQQDLPIQVALTLDHHDAHVDFAGSADQVRGNLNCPLSVAAAAVFYAFRCLMPEQTPACAGAFRPITLSAPEGSLLNARHPAAVAAGNVETSQRVVDAVLGALAPALPDRIPAASHGGMNNLAMGALAEDSPWDYYETLGGGMGGGPHHRGRSGVQVHMTNTLNTPLEALEMAYPLRLRRYALRRGSGGAGRHPGGEGVIREYEFLTPASVTLITERRRHAPWGLQGGAPGAVGENRLNGELLPGKVRLEVAAGDRLTVMTPGGGGWGGS
ncbi:hydantoinase B/oxoprolinase family protein [Alkalilimnicola ehrlichii MLHE-1]|uniref:5-oxoprolinase (ATP-hydrolyzing) n=1 Tax=Alkalilimnicola ehrlichii (strain ATCC BAA-1101 / DSM 17681 / MLHE-1) TaxID=187272 RepID=Q0A9N1_ALKEH|nr:hydantoinase B/oxoprolinase family protein [Alkalilimnicola ehrlichii]ABI56456.1 5-oxoprolinase (ATP-hydrolyzing) [Alkalilimnicola ehrlichii MLHE-1]